MRVGELQNKGGSMEELGEVKEINEKLNKIWEREEAYWYIKELG